MSGPYLGDYAYGDTIYVYFNTFNAAGASVTLTGLALTDILVYKSGSVTQRASTAGFTLLDSDGIDFDATTGIHGFSINTSDNTTAGFWAPNNDYTVVIASVTIDAQTVNFVACTFSLENRYSIGILQRGTITISTQTSFTLSTGSADNNAYFGATIVISDQATPSQKAVGVISAYTGSTRTVTLLADPGIFTMATGDHFIIYADNALKATVPTRTLDVSAGGEAGLDWANIGSPTTSQTLSGTTIGTATAVTTVNGLAANVITATSIASSAFAAVKFATDFFTSVKTQITDALNVDTYAEPGQGTPPATTTLVTKLGWVYKAFVNRHTQSASQYSLYNNAGSTVDAKGSFSDNGTTADRGTLSSGP